VELNLPHPNWRGTIFFLHMETYDADDICNDVDRGGGGLWDELPGASVAERGRD